MPGDNRALLLPCAAPVRGLGRYWVPFRPQLSTTPCLTRECNVKLVSGIGGFMELQFTPPLVYDYEAIQRPDIPEWRRNVLQLATPGLGRDCTLQLRESEWYWPREDSTLRLGPYLLVHGVAVDRDVELEHAAEEAALDLGGEGGLCPWQMMIEGQLIDDPVAQASIYGQIASAAIASRMGNMRRMRRAFKAKAAVMRIEGAFKRWKWRKAVVWNPHTALGRRLLQLSAEAGAAE